MNGLQLLNIIRAYKHDEIKWEEVKRTVLEFTGENDQRVKHSNNAVLADVPSFNQGDKVEWTYKHWLNSRQFTHITKEGVFIRLHKAKKKFLADWSVSPKAVVKFNGNKSNSVVPLNELRHISQHQTCGHVELRQIEYTHECKKCGELFIK